MWGTSHEERKSMTKAETTVAENWFQSPIVAMLNRTSGD